MKLQVLLVVATVLLWDAATVETANNHRAHTPAPTAPTTTSAPMDERLKKMEELVEGLSRQVMLQQFYSHETIRGDGDSGLKNMRLTKDGSRNYYETAHVGAHSYMAMHDHANYDRTVGLGELNVVMNGVEFRTRHNDYKLRMPSRTTKDYNKYEDIPFPSVPKSVSDKKNVTDQILEMREYFKAFKNQDPTHRDYRPYFKANLCYLEGAWTKASKDIDEPFQSDRHHIDAADWFDLMEKIQYTSYTGSKSVLENFAYLPTSIYKVVNGEPLYAQWNYRILCHPVSKSLPLSTFEPMDDLLWRFPMRKTMDQLKNSRAVRYVINEKKNQEDRYTQGKSLLDDMMMEIPGKDNYLADLHDESFGMSLEDVRYVNHTKLNTGYYHRYFKTEAKGAMGTRSVHRGFNDGNLWVAQTTNPKVIDMAVNSCHGRNRHQQCTKYSARYTYALPLEIVYTTPLASWNPYDLPERQSFGDVSDHGKRTGKATVEQAFNGTCSKVYYKTPSDFYSSGTVVRDPADTARKGVAILDKHGQMRMVSSSGTRISTPDIDGVGAVRLRYPIMPVHGEGANVWKELNALKQITMHMNRYSSLFEERPGTQAATNQNSTGTASLLHYELSATHNDPPGEHSHDFLLTPEELDEIRQGHHLTITTSENLGHSHVLELQKYRSGHLKARRCDGQTHCWDGHSPIINLLRN